MVNDAEANGTVIPDIIHVKLMGDGTQIAKELNIVNITFTIIEEGGKVMSIDGNHSLAILKVSESDDDKLYAVLKDIIDEARDLNCLSVEG